MRIAPIVFAVVVAAVTVWRWTRLRWPWRGLGVAVCGVLVTGWAGASCSRMALGYT